MTSRRDFLRRASFALLPMAVTERAAQDTSRVPGKTASNSGAAAGDTLAMPVGRRSAPLGPLDNDAGVIAIERRLRCSCGCTLDVYTCRTTDFSCTYSPAMHGKVVAQVQQGATAEQVIQWFVAQPEYGEKVLMAPAARGFNLMGYLVPGLTVTAFGLALAAWLVRRRATMAGPGPDTHDGPGAEPRSPDAEQLEQLRRALEDVES
jgi:cytochrome c-type biogenesis protein CcmH